MENKYWKLLLNLHTRHIIRELPENNQLNEQLQQLRNLDFKNFFLMANSSRIEKVLNNTNCNYFKNNFLWILVTLDFDTGKLFFDMPKCNQTASVCKAGKRHEANVSFSL